MTIMFAQIQVPGTDVELYVNAAHITETFKASNRKEKFVFIHGIQQAFELITLLDTDMIIEES